MTEERWKYLIRQVMFELEQGQYKGSLIQDKEIALIVSVLKDNVPFDTGDQGELK